MGLVFFLCPYFTLKGKLICMKLQWLPNCVSDGVDFCHRGKPFEGFWLLLLPRHPLQGTQPPSQRGWKTSVVKVSRRGGWIKLPLKMAGAVNYLMNLLLQRLGFCFLQIKNEGGIKSNFSEMLLRVFQACGTSLPPPPPEKGVSITDPWADNGKSFPEQHWPKAYGQALAVTKGFLLLWSQWGQTFEAAHGHRKGQWTLTLCARTSLLLPPGSAAPWKGEGKSTSQSPIRDEYSLYLNLWVFTSILRRRYGQVENGSGRVNNLPKWIQMVKFGTRRTPERPLLPLDNKFHSASREEGSCQFKGNSMQWDAVSMNLMKARFWGALSLWWACHLCWVINGKPLRMCEKGGAHARSSGGSSSHGLGGRLGRKDFRRMSVAWQWVGFRVWIFSVFWAVTLSPFCTHPSVERDSIAS